MPHSCSSLPTSRREARRRALVGAVLVTAFAVASRASAGEPPTPDAPKKTVPLRETTEPSAESTAGDGRVLGGHNLIAPTNFVGTQVNSSFRFAQGFGIATFALPSPLTGEETAGRLFLYGQQIGAQFGFSNRFSLDLRAEGAAAVGGDLDSILGIGALANLNVGALPKVRLFTLEDVGLQASVGAGLFYSRNIAIRPSALIGKVTGDVQGAEGSLVQQSSAVDVAPTLMLAEGLGPFAVQASFATRIPATGRGGEVAFDAGAHVALAFSKLSKHVPIALTGEASMTHAGKTVGTFGGGLYFSGRRDLDLGATFSTTTGDVSIKQGQMVMQYYF